MAISATSSEVAQAQGIASNPQSVLDKDSFMKLLLVELQHQDPTEPMDSEKILTQTSQLATLESAENTSKTMDELVTRLNASMDLQQNMGALSAIGKMASLGSNAVALQEGDPSKFEIYFEDEISSGSLTIKDKDDNVVRTIPLDKLKEALEADGKEAKGVLAFEWDGYSNDDEKLESGYYSVTADYTNMDGEAKETTFGIYPVESVRFEGGKPMMKLGSEYVPMDYIAEYF